MHSLPALVLCALLGSANLAVAAGEAPAPQVTIADGTLQGARAGDVEAFAGIPYAAPPVGELRWRAPQPAAPWLGVRSADQFGHDCMQLPVSWDETPTRTALDEDCLYLNVTRPQGAVNLPVLVWIYGGGFVNGASSAELYDGAHFASDGLVFVSFNYRLGRFGFFGFPALTTAKAGEPKGNYAYMDQIAALQWVHDNIARFGGDPDRLTIMGESAGGQSVLALLNAPAARGLFARAIVQSGGGRDWFTPAHALVEPVPAPSGEQAGAAFAHGLGIPGTDDRALSALRALPTQTIVGDLNMSALIHLRDGDSYVGPMIDGRIVTGSPAEAYANGQEAKVPLLIGADSGDFSVFQPQSKQQAFASFGAAESAAREAYDPDGTLPLPALAQEIGADRVMVEQARFVARAFADAQLPVYEYRFSYVPPAMAADSPYGAQHFSDVPFVFGTEDQFEKGRTVPGDWAVAAQIHGYWVNFAKTGDPNGPGLPDWPRYTTDTDMLLNMTGHGADAMPDPWKARLDAMAASHAPLGAVPGS